MEWYIVVCHNEGCPNKDLDLEVEQFPGTRVICGPCGGIEITDVKLR
jgi:hypothetical protein